MLFKTKPFSIPRRSVQPFGCTEQTQGKRAGQSRAFLSSIEILSFSEHAAAEYGKIRARLKKQGKIIGAYDLMIGAHALAENITLVTNNTRKFKRIENLSLENWAS
jgi:tRNA(fMet)-specific endonuclease VapC